MSKSPVASVAVVGPDGSPLFISKPTDVQGSIEVEAAIFNALESQVVANAAHPPHISDKFLGNFMKHEKYLIWCLVTALNYKIIVLTHASIPVSDQVIRSFCSKVASYATEAFLDPFYKAFSPITSPLFSSRVATFSQSVPAIPQTPPQ